MLRALSTAATGMEAQETRLDVTANNVANASTPGFKRMRAEFADLLYQQLRAPGAPTGAGTRSPTGVQVGMGVKIDGTSRSFAEGDLRQTGNPLDVAIEGNGFFAIQLPGDRLGYTRDGAFALDAEGRIVTTEGYPLVADVTVPPEAQAVSIAGDGTVTAVIAGEPTPVELGKLELTSFANPAGLAAMGKNLFTETAASGTPFTGAPGEDGLGTLAQGTLELSNVKVVEEMIDLISGQRAYETNARVVKAADEMLDQTARLG
ncbi:MAG: flagellar basal-body rod protein FlgG [Kofleriaceae bacterium]|nr:flagellar basal-body rod protein FlgG [Myxococcales bacterium]MCB9562642.1 flagellar basal-body rod protein FlgG [Kofleriaceae bacterium]